MSLLVKSYSTQNVLLDEELDRFFVTLPNEFAFTHSRICAAEEQKHTKY